MNFTITTKRANQYIGGEAIDLADNKTTIYVILNIDKTPPDITLKLNPIKLSDGKEGEEGNWYELIYSATDVLSGLKSLQAGLVIISLSDFKQELQQDEELEITIDEKKKEIEIEGSNPQEILAQLQSGLLTLNSSQILQLKIKQGDAKWKIRDKEKGLEIHSPSIIFKATASDYADNISLKELEFRKEKERNDE